MSENRHYILSAVYILFIKENKIALIRRFNTGYQDGNYTLPSGHIDAGETATECVVREAFEEVGVKINKKDLEAAHVIHRKSGERVYVDFYFIAHKWLGELENKEPNKCDDLSWFNLTNLPENIIPDVKSAIQNYQNGVFYSEEGWKSN